MLQIKIVCITYYWSDNFVRVNHCHSLFCVAQIYKRNVQQQKIVVYRCRLFGKHWHQNNTTHKYLFTNFPQYPEGDLTNLRSLVVRTENLSQVSKEIGLLPEWISVTRHEARSVKFPIQLGGSKVTLIDDGTAPVSGLGNGLDWDLMRVSVSSTSLSQSGLPLCFSKLQELIFPSKVCTFTIQTGFSG